MEVSVDNLEFSYNGGSPVFSEVSFKSEPGKITVIVGSNGAGKTTLLKCIAGLYRHEGEVRFDGNGATHDEVVRRLSYLDQNSDCDVDLTVFEVVLLGMVQTLGFRTSPEDVEKAKRSLELVGMSHLSGRKIGEVSGGQRQLIFIAQALVKNPDVLLLDEPTSALDLYHQMVLMKFMRKLTRERNCVTLMTLHHLDMALRYADKVIVLNEGHIIAEGRPEDVLNTDMLERVYHIQSKFITDEYGRRYMLVEEPIGCESDELESFEQ